MRRTCMRTATIAAATSAGLAVLALAGSASASSTAGGNAPRQQFQVRQVLGGARLSHTFRPAGSSTPMTEPLSSPDDVTMLGHNLFVTFQNGVGPQGQPSPDGNTDSTIVEFTAHGAVIDQWDLAGKCDGLTADPQRGVVIATINEDANSHIDTIQPNAPATRQVQVYAYNEPLPHFGGTDAISIYHGEVLVSASAPGTTGASAPQPTYPAVYSVTFDAVTHIATVTPLFYDEDPAMNVTAGPNLGMVAPLALTDPDSNEVVPFIAPRFGGDFMLTSQGDQEQIFVLPNYGGGSGPGLAVLDLAISVDDTAWATGPGRLFGASTSTDTVDEITGPFRSGQTYVAVTPCDANDAPATCSGPGFPPNYLGTLNPWTGAITAVPLTGPSFEPQGMIFAGR
ncbi:MAG: hypothetical protein WBH47_21685 [Streptosporangiaceae bacterium]